MVCELVCDFLEKFGCYKPARIICQGLLASDRKQISGYEFLAREYHARMRAIQEENPEDFESDSSYQFILGMIDNIRLREGDVRHRYNQNKERLKRLRGKQRGLVSAVVS